MFLLWERLKLVVEPTGALGAAAAMHGHHPVAEARVGMILTGGNVDFAQLPLLERHALSQSGMTALTTVPGRSTRKTGKFVR